MGKLREVMDGCKVCGKRMLTDGNPLTYRTCDKCKAKQQREHNRKLAAQRKAERHAAKQEMGVPRCQHCGKAIEDVARLSKPYHPWKNPTRLQWARKYCDNKCRQAAFRASHRNG